MKHAIYLSTILCLTSLNLVAQSEECCVDPVPTCPPVTLVCPDYCFEMHFAALFLQPFANNLDYCAEALPFNYGNAQPAVSPSWNIKEISPDFHFGFDVGIAAVFCGAHSSLMLNWERYHSPKDSSSITVAVDNDMVGPFFEIGPDASSYKKAKGSAHFDFDQVNLDYGTFVQFGELLRMNLFAGVGFNRLDQHYLTTFSNLDGSIKRTIDVPSKFIGAGPQLGFNFDYTIYKGLRFIGDARASLFVGNFKNHTTFKTSSNALVTLGDENPNVQTTEVHKKNGMVPGFEGKLGLAYACTFWCDWEFKLEAGYQAQIYLSAIRSIDMGSEVTLGSAGAVGSSTIGVYARTFKRTVSDFGMAGPYAAVSLAF